MILLHKDGSIIEGGTIEAIRPIQFNQQINELVVEITFNSGKQARYSDVWYAKGVEGKTSIYDLFLGSKFHVDWREIIRRVV